MKRKLILTKPAFPGGFSLQKSVCKTNKSEVLKTSEVFREFPKKLMPALHNLPGSDFQIRTGFGNPAGASESKL